MMEVLSQLDPGCTKVLGRYMGLALGAQHSDAVTTL